MFKTVPFQLGEKPANPRSSRQRVPVQGRVKGPSQTRQQQPHDPDPFKALIRVSALEKPHQQRYLLRQPLLPDQRASLTHPELHFL